MSETHVISEEPTPTRRRGMRLTTLMIGVLVIGGLLGLAVRAVDQAREAAREAQCRNNLKQIGLGLQNYHESYGCFPPATINDSTGKPIHSWRVLIYPFMESSSFYSSYSFAEPWDGPNNRKTTDQYWPSFYGCPSRGARRGLTSYVMIVGPTTANPGADSLKLSDIRNGVEQTIMIAEVSNVDIEWAEPRDLDAKTMSWTIDDPKRPGISSSHPNGPEVGFADGSIGQIAPGTSPATVKALTTVNVGKPVHLDKSP